MTGSKPLIPQGQLLVRPASRGMVYGSLFVAFLLTALPWPESALWLAPDLLLLAMVYWNIHAPRIAALGLAFTLGLAVDAAHGLLFGLHALSYSTAAFFVLMLRRRLERFGSLGQALHLAVLFPIQELLVILLGLGFGREVDWRYLAAGVVTTMLWLPVCALLNRLSGRPEASDAGIDSR